MGNLLSQNKLVRNAEITGIGFHFYHNARIHFNIQDGSGESVMCFFLKQPNETDLNIYEGVYISRILEPNITPLERIIEREFGIERNTIHFQSLQIYPPNRRDQTPTHTGILHGPAVWLLEKISFWAGSGAEVKCQILKQYFRQYEETSKMESSKNTYRQSIAQLSGKISATIYWIFIIRMAFYWRPSLGAILKNAYKNQNIA